MSFVSEEFPTQKMTILPGAQRVMLVKNPEGRVDIAYDPHAAWHSDMSVRHIKRALGERITGQAELQDVGHKIIRTDFKSVRDLANHLSSHGAVTGH